MVQLTILFGDTRLWTDDLHGSTLAFCSLQSSSSHSHWKGLSIKDVLNFLNVKTKTGSLYQTLREALKKNNDETYGKFHILGGEGVSKGSFSICYNDTFKMQKKPF